MKKKSLLLCFSMLLLVGVRSWATPTYSISISSGYPSDTICSGTTLAFSATPGTGAYGYIWNVDGSFVGTSSPTYTTSALPTGANTVYCLLTNMAGDTIYAVSDTLHLVIDTLPVNGRITGPVPASVCIGSTITLTDIATGGSWISGNPLAASISSSGVVTGLSLPLGGLGGPPTVRIYYVMTNSCGSDTSRFRVTIASPVGPISIAQTIICMDSAIAVNDSSGGGQWSTSDSLIGKVAFGIGTGFPPSIGEQLTGKSTGIVTVYYVDTNACGAYKDSVKVTIVNCDSAITKEAVADITANNGCTIFPNPATGSVNIMVHSATNNIANCVVRNMLGELVKTFSITTNHQTTQDMNLPPGLYYLTINAGEEKYTAKLAIIQ